MNLLSYIIFNIPLRLFPGPVSFFLGYLFFFIPDIFTKFVFTAPTQRTDQRYLSADFTEMQFSRPSTPGTYAFEDTGAAGSTPEALVINIAGIKVPLDPAGKCPG